MTAADSQPQRRALVVRGGWPGHVPVEASDSFLPYLAEQGFDTTTSETLDVYADRDLMQSMDLIVQCWTMGEITQDQLAGLRAAVEAGAGLAGWHGGIVDSFRKDVAYQQMTGGQFVAHPGNFVDYRVVVNQDRADHPIVAGITEVAVHTEQYWVLTDPAMDVLAVTTLAGGPDTPWDGPFTVPAVWTRRWGQGRVFVCTVGHHLPDLEVPEIRQIIERGFLWASR